MKKTALYDEHLKAKGRMVEFAGWQLPVMYSSIIEEHNAVRNTAGLFDVSHMGEFRMTGKDAVKELQKLVPTDLNKCKLHMGMYTCFTNESGGVIDDLFVFKYSEDDLYLVVNAGTREKDFQWLSENIKGDVKLEDISDDTAKIDIQGPLAKKILQEVLNKSKIDELNRFYFYTDSFDGVEVMVSQTGYTGELGYELYINNDKASKLWNEILEAGKSHGLIPAGLGARDTLRLEAAYSLYGHELSDEISPVESGIGWLISSKESFPGEEIIRQHKAEGGPRKLIAIELTGRGVPREGYEVKGKNGIVGALTSGAFGPTVKKGIALALVHDKNLKVGDTVNVIIRSKDVEAQVVKRPFYEYNG